MIFQCFYPDYEMDSAYHIDYPALYGQGYRGVIFDIDNTLVPHDAPADERAVSLFAALREIGFQTMLLSNNREPRVKTFGDRVGSRYLYKSGKPARRGYLRAMEMMGTSRENTIFVGDQIFSDVWGANRAGIITYLTRPIHPKEEIQIVIKRYFEKIVLYFYHKRVCAKAADSKSQGKFRNGGKR